MGPTSSIRLSVKLAVRELQNDPRFALFFAINLALGLSGFVVLDALESSVAYELQGRSKTFLGADISVSSSRPLTGDERRAFDAAAGAESTSDWVELFSMASGTGAGMRTRAGPKTAVGSVNGARARLVEIRAIDSSFPLYGQIVLDGVGPAGSDERSRLGAGGTWVDRLLLAQLGVEVGDVLKIGSAMFEIQHRVGRDTGRMGGDLGIAPRIYISLDRLEATGLIVTGGLASYRHLIRLADDQDSEAIALRMRQLVSDPTIRVRSHQSAARELARGFATVNDYLGLISLIAVFLAALGASHLFREFLSRRVRDVAILLCLGATRMRAQGVFVAQVWLLALAAALFATFIAAIVLPLAGDAAAALSSAAISPRVGARSLALALALALAGSTAACLPLLLRIRSLRPAELFVEHARPSLETGRDLLLLAPALMLFWAAAIWRVDDLRVGSLFTGLFALALAVFALLGRALLQGLDALPRPGRIGARLALRHLSRARASALGGFVSIALCAFLVSLAPQLQGAIQQDLDPPDGGRLPSLFLFDIQPEQLDDLTLHVADRGLELRKPSPLVRARLETVKGQPAGRRSRGRTYNLTYPLAVAGERDPDGSERLIAGTPFGASTRAAGESEAEPAQVSLEHSFAARLGIGIGDTLSFDVQGVPIFGRITSLREVHWNSFQPNFFIAFARGVLEQAPQTMLASLPPLVEADRERLQASIVERFPNISVIDVTAAVRQMLGLLGRLQWALQSTASVSLIVGMVLIYAVARDQARARRAETNLLKVLGADFRTVRSAVDIEFGLLGALATALGIAASVAASAVLANFALEANWTINWLPLLLVGTAAPILCVLTARLATRKVLRESPLALLQAAET
ncbi:MAG: FtsX-like permease family protein [Myxococcota bacterium]